MWPFPTPWDVTAQELDELKEIARPGDIIVERNIHSWQWMLLSQFFTGSNWVHVAVVDENKDIINMAKTVKREDLSTYLQKQSTDMRLVRPPYRSDADIAKVLKFARSKIGTKFDPDFQEQSANCTGLIASSLKAGGIEIPSRQAPLFKRTIYSAEDILNMRGGRLVWSLHDHTTHATRGTEAHATRGTDEHATRATEAHANRGTDEHAARATDATPPLGM